MKFLGANFFEKDKLDSNVLVPLSQAQRHKTVEAEYQRRQSEEQMRQAGLGEGKDKKDGSDTEKQARPLSSSLHSPYTIEGLRAEVMEDMRNSGHDSVYDSELSSVVKEVFGGWQWTVKSLVINKAIQDIGMGRYNWQLFVLCGFGWFADKYVFSPDLIGRYWQIDSLWLQGVALTLPSLQTTFGVSEKNVRYTTCSLFIGLCVGASFWGKSASFLLPQVSRGARSFSFSWAVHAAPNLFRRSNTNSEISKASEVMSWVVDWLSIWLSCSRESSVSLRGLRQLGLALVASLLLLELEWVEIYQLTALCQWLTMTPWRGALPPLLQRL
jgi:hypothetical protein